MKKPAITRRKSKKAKHEDDQSDSDTTPITWQLPVKKLVTLTSILSCWTVPQLEEDIAYLLDLLDNPRDWIDSKGNLLSMAAIIKGEVRLI